MTDHTDELTALAMKHCPYPEGTPREAWRKGFLGERALAAKGSPYMAAYEAGVSAATFTHALRQQDLARMARMREALAHYGAHDRNCAWCKDTVKDGATLCDCGLNDALSETSDVQEWMDGQMEQWQTIETAPKDGTFILVANRSGAWIACYRKYAGSGFEFRNPWMSMMLNHDHMERSERWDAPTHWIPLPAAPSARSTKGK